MKNSLLFIFCLFVSYRSVSQTYTWATADSMYYSSLGTDLSLDHQGNLVVAELNSPGASILKYNSNDSLLFRIDVSGWMIRTPAVCTDAFNNIFLTLTLGSDLLVNGNTYTNGSMYLIKYDSSGVFQWIKQATGQAFSTALSTDGTGNVYVAGGFMDYASFDSLSITSPSVYQNYIATYSPTGVLRWVKHGSVDHFGGYPDIETDASGNTYISGTFLRTVKFDSLTLTAYYPSGTQEDIYLAKIDSSGNWIWAVHAGGIYQDNVSSLATDTKGNLYISGFIASPTATFGNIGLVNTGANDYFVAKYDTSGTALWAFNGGGSGGQYGGPLCIDSSEYIYMVSSSHFINKFDSLGNNLWWQNKSGANAAMIINNRGNIYITGSFGDSIHFDNYHLTVNSAGSDRMYVAKLEFQSSIVNINETKHNDAFLVYPNPSTSSITICCSTPEVKTEFTLRVINSLGKTIHAESIKNTTGTFTKQLDVGTIPKGIYFIELISDNGKKGQAKKIIIQ
ncbi:MAG: T9SS type A sorting domain-containing protein [Bacteroidia bacterium]